MTPSQIYLVGIMGSVNALLFFSCLFSFIFSVALGALIYMRSEERKEIKKWMYWVEGTLIFSHILFAVLLVLTPDSGTLQAMYSKNNKITYDQFSGWTNK